MKASVNRDALQTALSHITKVVERKNTIPVLAMLKAVAEGETLTLTGTNLDRWMTITLPAQNVEPGEVCIPAVRLKDFTQAAPQKTAINVNLNDDGSRITITCGRARNVLGVLPAKDFPVFDDNGFGAPLPLANTRFAHALDRVIPFESREETRYYLNGTYLDLSDGAPCLVATDGHRIGTQAIPFPEGAGPNVILPRGATAILADLAERDDAALSWNEGLVRLTAENIVFTSKLIDATYPDWRRAMPIEEYIAATVTVDSDALSEALALALAGTGDPVKKVKLTCQNSGVIAIAHSFEGNDGAAETDCDADGDFEFGVSGRYLESVIDAADKDRITLQYTQPGQGILITCPDDETARFVIMPIHM